MRYAHRMPFGTVVADGATQFRLWAPSSAAVAVEINGGRDGVHLLAPQGNGWFEARVEGIGADTRYAFRCDGGAPLPDPASRANPAGVHGPSCVVDPLAYEWQCDAWRGRPWHESVIYELHTGTFTPAGTFTAIIDHLDALAALGVTAIELMPVADFPGMRNWGYDGVLPFAPARCYGTPGDLKRLVDAAHARGLMMLLDVVYNHFGPEGNYLHDYARPFFESGHATPWGEALNFAGPSSRTVRDFFVHNALYWLEEFQFDGLRLDAVHAIVDPSATDIVSEIAESVRAFARTQGRHVHLILENDRNEASRLARDACGVPLQATAQWNDDVHHALHVLLTGEVDGYYTDFAPQALRKFGRGLAEGFVYQGDASPFRDGETRGEPSATLPPTAFVNYTQTHDQVGNRAFGERLAALAAPRALRAVTACVLLAPAPPMLFMGEDFGASSPFLFFCDFGPDLAEPVSRGRRAEFDHFARFRDAALRAQIPDPNALTTFAASALDWNEARHEPGLAWLDFYRHCLDVRQRHIVPRLADATTGGTFSVTGDALLRLGWPLGRGCTLHMAANLGDDTVYDVAPLAGIAIHESDAGACAGGRWRGHTVAVAIEQV